ncbi:MAG: hypothetical protein KC414_11835, partial [Romboutsia sp.]|nr:hypothetical protein [Romboutsia sp.]
MKILIVVDSFLPQKKAAAIMMYELAVEFVKNNDTVYVITPGDDLQSAIVYENYENINIIRVSAGKIKDTAKIIRAWNESRLSSIIWRKAKLFFQENKCDLVIAYSPTIFFGKLLNNIKKKWQCKVYLIIRDIFPQWAVDAKLLNKNLV